MEIRFVSRIRDLISRLILGLDLLWSSGRLACCARYAALRNCCFALSAMKWPVSIAVIVGRFCKAAMRSPFLRPARYLLRQTIYGLKDCYWSEHTLCNKENVMIIIWSEETLKHILGGGLVGLYEISEFKSIG